MKNDQSCCRLCFVHADEPIAIFGDAATEFNIVDVLAQYFLDQVTRDDALPKIVCHDCCSQIETFHSFVQRVIAVREEYFRQQLNGCVKEEEVPDESAVLLDEREIHEENFCVEPVSMVTEDPLKGEIELMDTKFQIDMETEENEAVHSNDDEECDDTWSDADQIDDQNITDTEPLATIDVDDAVNLNSSALESDAKSSGNALESQSAENRYICDICSNSFAKKSGVKRHLLTHQTAKCHICNERFGSQKRLKRHLKMSHVENLEGYKQEVYGMVFNVSDDQIKKAMDLHVKKTCDLCSTEFSSFLDARNHYSKFHNSLGHLRCCNYKLKTNTAFLEHTYWHFNPTVFVCRICQEVTKTRATLMVHLKMHETLETKRFACKKCDKTLITSYKLKNHIMRKHSQKTIQPSGGSLPSDHSMSGQQTLNAISMNESTSVEQNDDTAIAEYFDMTCDLCPVVFTSFKDAQSHYLNVHRMENGYLKCCQTKFKAMRLIKDHLAWHKDPNTFGCDECSKSFLNRHGLVKHKKTHSRDFVCDICSKTYPTKWKLSQHILSHEKHERSFICSVCNKGFYNQKAQKKHEKIHTQQKTLVCEYCGKTFSTQHTLKSHVAVHGGTKNEPQFQCNICQKRFLRKQALSSHMVTHLGPQKCDQCDKIAPNLNALKQHITASHCEPKFECHLCDKKFRLKPALKDHIATHKGERNYKCTFCDEAFIWRTNMYTHRKKMHKEQWMAEKARIEEKLLKP